MTETWLGTNGRDRAVEKDITPTRYKLLHLPRTHWRGGGVGILYKNNIDIKRQQTKSFQSFEHLELLLDSNGKWARLIVLYRPPPSVKKQVKCGCFYGLFHCSS